ncbi:N-formylglutamate amidohydrolase [Phenylobacterium sp.]|uniref:N-formylglutamate amidohydrolase n=1 Tax=Phenylobacterium sp. TaxID=1871053 RepID=UPI002E2FF267|nr:N-formylglutamate amidohydrolase [Phenylobacterium sp.]HEX3364895.1 N-formylglutamate amidohydrolase [Phenylobacterium sp.]
MAIALNPGAASPFLLLGDHAGREIPQQLRDLGLPPAELDRHIAWDIGVAGYGALLSQVLDATFIRQRFSRLVIDCNRDPARADAIPEISDGADIPGNRALSPPDREARITEIARPYQAAIAAELDARAVRGLATTLISLHSFTPRMDGVDRPWRFGVLHAGDSPYSRAVLARLRGELGEALVGDNEPYRMDEVDFTIPLHAGGRGLDYLELEVRQDLVADPAGQAQIAAFVARLLPTALADVGRT